MSDNTFPLQPIEIQVKHHALLCATGFLVLLPIGALIARYVRTFYQRWWYLHAGFQFLIAGPVIFAGFSLGHKSATQLGLRHYVDPHQKMGLALLLLYLLQLALGAFIHFVKIPNFVRRNGGSGGNGGGKPRWWHRRPPQNYLHVFLGLVIFIVAASQVHYGLFIEWTFATGGLHKVVESAKHAWVALIVLFWVFYIAGLGLLRRQFRQEAQGRTSIATKEEEREQIQMNGSPPDSSA